MYGSDPALSRDSETRRRVLIDLHSANADLAFDRGDELRRVVADAVLEHDRHLSNLGRRGDRVAANDDEIGDLAGGNRPEILVHAEDLGAVERHDLNRFGWREA